MFLLALAAEAACGAVVFSSLFTWLVVSSLLGLFFYSFAVFCAMFTGHILALPAFYVVLNGLAAGLAVLFGQMAHEFLFGFDGASWLSGIATWLSPWCACPSAGWSTRPPWTNTATAWRTAPPPTSPAWAMWPCTP